jgi:methyl coenzyme M reductase subunit C
MPTKKKKTAKSRCASTLGRKGGLATKAAKKGIFSAAYKNKVKKKATPKRRKATKKKK